MIIKNTAQIREVIPVNIGVDTDNLKPFINTSEFKYLIPVIGVEQFNALDLYASGTTLNDELEALLKQCITPIVLLSLYDGFDLLNVEFSNSGFHRSESETKKGLYGYQERNIKSFLKTSGFNGLDNLLAFLDSNIDDYPLWADSIACSTAYDSLIRTAKEFTLFYNPLKNSSIVFRNLKSAMQRAEDFQIKTVIGSEIVDLVKELIKDREIDLPENAKYKTLLPLIQKPLAYLTIEEGAKELGVKLTDTGLFFEQVDAGLIPDNISSTTPDSKIEPIIHQAHANGKKYLSILVEYLQAHTADYPEYEEINQVVEVADQTSKNFYTVY